MVCICVFCVCGGAIGVEVRCVCLWCDVCVCRLHVCVVVCFCVLYVCLYVVGYDYLCLVFVCVSVVRVVYCVLLWCCIVSGCDVVLCVVVGCCIVLCVVCVFLCLSRQLT